MYNGPAPDKPIEIKEDGSFQFAAKDDRAKLYEGRKIADVRNGLVAQRLIYAGGCEGGERLLLVDCNHGHLAYVHALYDASESGMSYSSIDSILAPAGAIKLGKMDFFEILAAADKHDYTVDTDVLDQIRMMKKKNRFDPYFGCKKYYPDSVGARRKI